MRANLATGFEMLSGNFMRLASMSQTELAKVDETAMLEEKTLDRLKSVARLTRMANDSVEAPLRMAAAVEAMGESGEREGVDIRGGMPD